jgi:hypothetical protein
VNIEYSELLILDEQQAVTLYELVELSGMTVETLVMLVESGALVPKVEENDNQDTWQFNCQCVETIRTLSRLKQAFDLEENALGLLMVLLERIKTLENQSMR